MNPELQRLETDRLGHTHWHRWGPYLSDRQWGTVREDYSADGDAWTYFPHGHARSRAYRWGEDGLAGVCDDQQYLCLAVAVWNGRDPFLKERLFGLTNSEGNHGEDVKELYFHLDATPTSTYLKFLYKYPQKAFPYAWLVEENRRRDRNLPEFELLDSGVFAEDRYFDVVVEYAKAGPDDVLLRVTAHNRGPDEAALEVLPHLWFRNTWSWQAEAVKPKLSALDGRLVARHVEFGEWFCHADGATELLFCDNETNVKRVFGVEAPAGYYKDAIHEYVVHGNRRAVNPKQVGTKSAMRFPLTVPAGASRTVRVRLTNTATTQPFADFDAIFTARLAEADQYFADLQQDMTDADARLVQRQAWAGMLWNKQVYRVQVARWLDGDPAQPPPPASRKHGRNADWRHLHNSEVISMPDKWEYPWYAAWDLAFHCLPLAHLDPEFAKNQLVLLTRAWYMHPNGQLPAYEWAFGDVNPPVHAWATWRVYQIDRKQRGGQGDRVFLERVLHKLLMNFTWWVNRKDATGRNIFQGGFLGLDNIGVFDRNQRLLDGAYLNQADATSWMAMYCLNLMRMSLELAQQNPAYQDLATKFLEHFLSIAEAMTHMGGDGRGVGLWDEEDEFYYDQISEPGGQIVPLKVRSMVGLTPLFAVETLEPELLERVPEFNQRLQWYLKHRPDLANLVSRWHEPGRGDRRLLSLLRGHRMKCLLRRLLDPNEFLSDYGVRALSRVHLDNPYRFSCHGQNFEVRYVPGESDSAMFGGNSNWRGPIWMPVNYLLIESLQKFHHYYGDEFLVECPVGSGQKMTLLQVAEELTRRLTRIFLKDESGRRPVFGEEKKLQSDPHFRDLVLFHEYFHGDSGRGVGAEHQTGWTGLIAKLLRPRRPDLS